MIRAGEIHARLSSAWPRILLDLGIPESALSNKHGPCPACGGKDRFRFDNKRHHGDFICNQCGAGDGFTLLQRVYGWSFSEAVKRVVKASGITSSSSAGAQACARVPARIPDCSRPVATAPARVLRLRRGCCALEACADAVNYLASRALWPLPSGCSLKAHASLEYRTDEGQRMGRYPAIVADIVDLSGEIVAVHRTYLSGGNKLTGHGLRKQLGPLHSRVGCVVRLMPLVGDVLGVGEGLETCLAAATLHGVPTWAALNTALLTKFEPPPGVKKLILFADRDEAGLTAARKLMERLQGRLRVETRIPSAPAKDWNDVLLAQRPPQQPLRATKDLPMNKVIALQPPLPDTLAAPLPQRYEAARTALAACADIDEVQDWADKAAAVASYARQSKDDSLLVMAKRIRARAVRRCGELLSQIPASSGGDRGNSATGGRPPVGETRSQAATAAGLSDHQRKTALRVAAVPAAAFESQVESPRPPSVTQFAHEGTAGVHRRAGARPSTRRVEYETPTACEALAAFVRFCGQNEPTRLARCCSLEYAAQLRHYIAQADRWLERFLSNLRA